MKLVKALPLILACAVAGTAALASSRVSESTQNEITTKMAAEGYDVRKIEIEDGEIEVYALKDGKRLEIYLNPDLSVNRIKTND